PLKPTPPDEAQLITAPVVSVIETIVLLNVDLMWAWPATTFFLSLRRGLRAACLGAAIECSPESFVCWSVGTGVTSSYRRRCASDPCGCGRSSLCADRARAGHGGGGDPG